MWCQQVNLQEILGLLNLVVVQSVVENDQFAAQEKPHVAKIKMAAVYNPPKREHIGQRLVTGRKT